MSPWVGGPDKDGVSEWQGGKDDPTIPGGWSSWYYNGGGEIFPEAVYLDFRVRPNWGTSPIYKYTGTPPNETLISLRFLGLWQISAYGGFDVGGGQLLYDYQTYSPLGSRAIFSNSGSFFTSGLYPPYNSPNIRGRQITLYLASDDIGPYGIPRQNLLDPGLVTRYHQPVYDSNAYDMGWVTYGDDPYTLDNPCQSDIDAYTSNYRQRTFIFQNSNSSYSQEQSSWEDARIKIEGYGIGFRIFAFDWAFRNPSFRTYAKINDGPKERITGCYSFSVEGWRNDTGEIAVRTFDSADPTRLIAGVRRFLGDNAKLYETRDWGGYREVRAVDYDNGYQNANISMELFLPKNFSASEVIKLTRIGIITAP